MMKIPDEFMQTNEEYNSSRRGSVDVAAFKVKIHFTAKMNFDIYSALSNSRAGWNKRAGWNFVRK